MESFFRNVSKWYVLIDDVYEVYYLIHYFTWMVVCVLRKWSTTFILLSSINKACSHGRRSTVVVPNPVVNGTYLSRRLRRGRKEGSNDASSFFFMTKRRGEKKKKSVYAAWSICHACRITTPGALTLAPLLVQETAGLTAS